MYKVKRLVIMLGRLALLTCFSIECPGGSETNFLILEGKSGVIFFSVTIFSSINARLKNSHTKLFADQLEI